MANEVVIKDPRGNKPTVTNNRFDTNTIIDSSLVPEKHDYISLGYTGNNLTTVVYKTGGSGGATVATLTLAYTGDNLISVTRS